MEFDFNVLRKSLYHIRMSESEFSNLVNVVKHNFSFEGVI
jgi:hypothetical protein